nr:hypothetical protein GCM10020092_044310 [Actinoplanes digitatis]
MLAQRVTMTGSPCVRWYASASRSEPAFVAAYGELGDSGDRSVQAPVAIEPYTSSVETCTKRDVPCRRAASSSTWVPTTFVVANSAAPAMERSTCDSAAKCTTASWRGRTDSIRAASQMSPGTKSRRRLWLTGFRLSKLLA